MIREVLTMAELRSMGPDEAAALWTVRLAEGEHAHERDLFEEWLDVAPANRQAWERAQRGWNLFDTSADDELLEEMRRHARQARPYHSNWKRFAAAAAALLVVVSSSIFIERGGMLPGADGGRGSNSATAPVAAASFTYASGRELPKLITLPDGSRMTLDAQSRVTAEFSPTQRNLELVSGRAFFDVRHDASRPFAVRAGSLRLVDIGTKFDVERRQKKIQVNLTEGRVSVTAPSLSRPLLLAAGDRLTAVGDARPEINRIAGGAEATWQTGFASFDNMRLGDAAAVLNRYPGPELVVQDPRVANLRVSGMFKLGDAERFGRTLEQIYPVRVEHKGGQVEIVPAG
jgi:transmembrane sensor